VPTLLRGVLKDNWLERLPDEPDEAPADTLKDFRSTRSVLSVWSIAEDSSNLDKVVVMIALGKQKLGDFDLILFDEQLLHDLGIRIDPDPFDGPVPSVREDHRDLVGISANQVARFATALFMQGVRAGESGINVDTYSEKRLEGVVKTMVASAVIDVAKLNGSIRRDLETRGVLGP